MLLIQFSLAAEPKVSLRRANAALRESLAMLIAEPSRAQLFVLQATRSPVLLSVAGDYSRTHKSRSIGVHLQKLTYRAQEDQITVAGAVSFSSDLRAHWKIPLNTALLETFLRDHLEQYLGPNFRVATTTIGVRPLKKVEWSIEVGYRLLARGSDFMASGVLCELTLSPLLVEGECVADLDSSSPRGAEGRFQAEKFVQGLLRADPEAMQWWVDYVASWDAWVRKLFAAF